MEVLNPQSEGQHLVTDDPQDIPAFEISSNWQVIGINKHLKETITTTPSENALSSMTLDDIVNQTTCLEMEPPTNDCGTCKLDIKLKNAARISKIGIVSEASILEIFKEFGEYDKTVYCEFIDEFEGQTVNYAEIIFDRPTPETTIKFTRIINNDRSTMFLYGIRLAIDKSYLPRGLYQFDLNLINDFFRTPRGKKSKSEMKNHENPVESDPFATNNMLDNLMSLLPPNASSTNNNLSPGNNEDIVNKTLSLEREIEMTVDKKLHEMETRLNNKIDQVEMRVNKKLDDIIKLLETIKA